MDILGKLNINQKSLLFFYKLEPYDVDEDGVKYIIVDNKKKLVELDCEKIVGTYNFPFPLSKIEKFKVFYSYQPKLKYYIILFFRFIIILKKTDQLSFIERINDVRHFDIKDYYDNGRPQVVIHFVGKDQPLVTDFTQDANEPKVTLESENPVLYGLNLTITSQLKFLNAKVKETEKHLEEKNRMVSTLIGNMLSNYEGVMLSCDEQLVNSQSSNLVNCEPLSVGLPWVRSYLGKWIIGFPVTNLLETAISKINIFIVGLNSYIEKTLLFVPLVKSLEGSEFKIALSLLGHKIGVVIGVMIEPEIMITNSVMTFSCYASFCRGYDVKINQIYLGKVSVTSQDILSHNMTPFHYSKSFKDIITYLSVSIKTALYLKDNEKKQQFLNNLKDNYGFTQVTDRYIVNVMGNSVFNGVLISVETNLLSKDCTLQFYTQDYRQLTLLLQCLHKYQFESPTPIAEPDLSNFYLSIKEELKAVQNIITGNIETPKLTNCDHLHATNSDDSFHHLTYLNHYESKSFQNM